MTDVCPDADIAETMLCVYEAASKALETKRQAGTVTASSKRARYTEEETDASKMKLVTQVSAVFVHFSSTN